MWDSTARKSKNVPKKGWETLRFSSNHRGEEKENNLRNVSLGSRHENGIWTARGSWGERVGMPMKD